MLLFNSYIMHATPPPSAHTKLDSCHRRQRIALLLFAAANATW